MICDTVLDCIGGSPVVRLHATRGWTDAEIVVKLEAFNPAGSIKDRPALRMIEEAEHSGQLAPGGTIVESSSGNMAKALALTGAVKGYRVVLVIDPKTPRSVTNFARALGAELEVVTRPDPSGGYQRGRRRRVEELIAQIPGAYWPNQMENPANPRTHEETTGYELLADVGDFDTLVVTASTGGHASGLSTTVKRHRPEVRTLVADVAGSAAFGEPFSPYRLRGLGLAWEPVNLDRSVVDDVQVVTDAEALGTMRVLARSEGLLVGESGGAGLFAALCCAHGRGGRILVVAADGGANYADESFSDEWLAERGLLERIEQLGLTSLGGLVRATAHPTHRRRSAALAAAGA